MATKKTKNTQVTINQEVETTPVVEAAEVVEAIVEEVETKKTSKAKKNKEKVSITVPVMDNEGMMKLFHDNGCLTRTAASNTSNVVYNTFGTQSRILQQKRAYQLLLTNGHKSTKNGVVETENDDTARFVDWYETLSAEQQAQIIGYNDLAVTKLSATELPRERTVKLQSYDLLVAFIQYMSKFPENQLVKAAE